MFNIENFNIVLMDLFSYPLSVIKALQPGLNMQAESIIPPLSKKCQTKLDTAVQASATINA